MPSFGADWHCGPIIESFNKPFVRIFDIRKFKNVTTEEEYYINHLFTSFNNAEQHKSQLPDFISNRNILNGMSGSKTRHFYNNLASMPNCNYLEIGTWAGSTLCSNLYSNNINATAIDSFEWGGFEIKQKFFNNVMKCKTINNEININSKNYEINIDTDNDKILQVFDSDSFKVNINDLKFTYNLYLYDGDHSYDSHYKALIHYINKLNNIFIFIVDDWNIPRVRDATYRSIKDLNLNILSECEVIYTHDDTHTTHNKDFASLNFWNGIYAVVLTKNI
jgi:hypothetical protein